MRGRKRIYLEELNKDIFDLYVNQFMSLSFISQQLDVPPEIVKRRLKEMGVTIRSKSEAMILFHKKKGTKNG